MTYVIGISHRGNNSILADQRISYVPDGSKGENISVKIGQLFPGCIFGATGNVLAFDDFLISAKNHCGSTLDRKANWMQFQEFVNWYRPPTGKNEHFQILLSHSDGDKPQWFVYDTIKGLNTVDANILTLGSGKESLDTYIDQYYDIFVTQMDELLNEKAYFAFRHELPPYLFAYYFTQLSTMTYKLEVERIGVGGVFTFIGQTSTTEFFQKPSLYLFGLYDKNRKHISIWSHHLWFDDNWLIVESTIPPDYCKPSDSPTTVTLFSNDLMQPSSPSGSWDADLLASKIKSKVLNPSYSRPKPYFQKIGHCNPITNPQSGFSLGYGALPIINDKGQLLEDVLVWLGIKV